MERFFCPWKGSDYEAASFGAKILILGESHYERCVERRTRDYTITTVKDLGQTRRHRFFTMTQKLISGVTERVSIDCRREFWEKVAFCNFIQAFLEAARQPVTDQMWSSGKEPLRQTIRELHPELIIVLGNRLHAHLHLPDLSEFGAAVRGIPHPSGRGFQLQKSQKVIREAIEAVAEKRAAEKA